MPARTPSCSFSDTRTRCCGDRLTVRSVMSPQTGCGWRRDVDVEHAVLAVKQAASTISGLLLEKNMTGAPEGDGPAEPAEAG